MGNEQEETAFQVRDRRAFLQEAAPEKKVEPNPAGVKKPETTAVPPHQEKSPSPTAEASIPVTFSSYILSLGTAALIHLGAEANPATGERSVALPLARQVIDLIALLEEKTKGNLVQEEETFLKELLFTLRMKYVEVEKKRRP